MQDRICWALADMTDALSPPVRGAPAQSAKPVAAKDEPDDERKRRDDTPPAANAAPGPAPADPAVIAGDAFLPVVDIEKPFLTKGFKSFAELSKKPRIRIQNLEVGTSVEDIEVRRQLSDAPSLRWVQPDLGNPSYAA